MCIFDLEFLSNTVSLLLCLAVSDCLSPRFSDSLELSPGAAAPVYPCSCLQSLPQPPFSELGTGSNELHTFPVVNTHTPPLGLPALPLGSTKGWGGRGGGLSWLLRTSAQLQQQVLRAENGGGKGTGRGGGGAVRRPLMLTSWGGKPAG